MIRYRVTNKFSNYANQVGVTPASEWDRDQFWVPVTINGLVVRIARYSLTEC